MDRTKVTLINDDTTCVRVVPMTSVHTDDRDKTINFLDFLVVCSQQDSDVLIAFIERHRKDEF